MAEMAAPTITQIGYSYTDVGSVLRHYVSEINNKGWRSADPNCAHRYETSQGERLEVHEGLKQAASTSGLFGKHVVRCESCLTEV